MRALRRLLDFLQTDSWIATEMFYRVSAACCLEVAICQPILFWWLLFLLPSVNTDDQSRIILKEGETDYINANLVEVSS